MPHVGRLEPVTNMRPGFPRVTQICMLILALDLVSASVAGFLFRPPGGAEWVAVLDFCVSVMGAISVLAAHCWSQRQGETLTLSFNSAIVAYLFSLGVGNLTGGVAQCYSPSWRSPTTGTAAQCKWGVIMVGPIHLIPPLAMLTCRHQPFFTFNQIVTMIFRSFVKFSRVQI